MQLRGENRALRNSSACQITIALTEVGKGCPIRTERKAIFRHRAQISERFSVLLSVRYDVRTVGARACFEKRSRKKGRN